MDVCILAYGQKAQCQQANIICSYVTFFAILLQKFSQSSDFKRLRNTDFNCYSWNYHGLRENLNNLYAVSSCNYHPTALSQHVKDSLI